MRRQSSDNRILRSRRSEKTRAGQDRNGILRVLEQPFEGNEQKGLVFRDREARRAAKLIAGQGILRIDAVNVRLGRIENRTRRQRLRTGKRVSGIQRIIAKITVKGAVQLVRPGLGDDVNRCAARSPELRRVIAAVDLKLQNRVLTQRETHSTRVIIGFPTVNGDAIAAAIAAIERKAALRR